MSGGKRTEAPKIAVAPQMVVAGATARQRVANVVEAAPTEKRDPSPRRQIDDDPLVARDPRPGSKLESVLGQLRSKSGATLVELVAATGWLPHSARAALTGLRKRGYELTLTRGERGGASVYRAVAPVGEAKP